MEACTGIMFIVYIFLAIVGLFLIFRFIVLWYYKIDRRVELLVEQNRLLREILNKLKTKNE